MEIKSRGNVYGGKEFNEKTAAGIVVPDRFLPKEKTSSRQGAVYNFSTGVFGSERIETQALYEGQKESYDRYCCFLHSVYPAAFKPKDCECKQ